MPVARMKLIAEVFDQVSYAAELKPRLMLIKGSAPNAAAGPIGGQPTVLVNFGMVRLAGRDEHQWAAVLGHELAHLKLDHATSNILRRVPLEFLKAYAEGKLSKSSERNVARLAIKLFDTKFSREQERQSDYLGAIWTVESGYHPMGAARLHQGLLNKYGDKGIPFLESHPTSRERVESLTNLSNRLMPE